MAKKRKKNNQSLWIGLGIVIIVLVILFSMFDISDLTKLIPGGEKGEEKIFNAETYYADLEAGCDDVPSTQRGCCIISVSTMEKWGYKLADEDGNCPAGFEADTFNCPGAYDWCESAE